MLCDKCRQNEANVHVTRIINGVKYEQNLCSHCAHEQESDHYSYSGGYGMSGLEQLINFFRGLGMVGVVMAPGQAAANRMGVPQNLEDLGLSLPSGSAENPETQSTSIESLRAELSSAVANEKYERAAELRDEIFQLEKQQELGQN